MEVISKLRKKDLEKQGYRIVGNHSAVKLCLWCKKSLINSGAGLTNASVCYKEKFYGIKSHRCVQMTPALAFCLHKCMHCWRDVDFTFAEWQGDVDEPKEIVNGCIAKQRKLLAGLKGHKHIDMKKFNEALEPKHFAISLAGDACMYPKLPELIEEIHKAGCTSFLVTNGMMPEMLAKSRAYQPYVSLNAYNEENYRKMCRPLIADGWERLMKSLKILGKFERGTIRMTLVRGWNFPFAREYAELLKDVKFRFLEIKAGLAVGYAQYRMNYSDMLRHVEIRKFTEELCLLNGWKIADEQKESRVCLAVK